jgi:SsrA-binding protein
VDRQLQETQATLGAATERAQQAAADHAAATAALPGAQDAAGAGAGAAACSGNDLARRDTLILLSRFLEGSMPREKGRKVVASNRKARHDYEILETLEAGIALTGTEVKSLRAGRCSLVDAFGQISEREVYLHAMHIPEYTMGTWTNHPPRRVRKLLLKRSEIDRIGTKVRESGLTLVPLSVYFSDGWAKVEIGLARGKKSYDKRQSLAKRDAEREISRVMGSRNKGRSE